MNPVLELFHSIFKVGFKFIVICLTEKYLFPVIPSAGDVIKTHLRFLFLMPLPYISSHTLIWELISLLNLQYQGLTPFFPERPKD
jgi:hypothetical protein